MKFSRVDARLVYANEWREALDLTQPIPRGWVAVDPPAGEGYWQWAGNRWLHLDEYPAPPEPPVVVKSYDKLKIVDVIDGMGRLAEFQGMLSSAPLRVQLRWQAAGHLRGDDADFQNLVGIIAASWQLTPAQVADILQQCES